MVFVEKKLIDIGYRPDGSPIRVPFIRIGDGEKRLFIAAAVHGNEITGIVSIWKFIDYIKEMNIHGEIGIVPIINIEGFNYNTRGIPLTTIDLNRIYPGDPLGHMAERITAKIWSLAREYGFVLDMHTAGFSIPFILLDPAPRELKEKILEIAIKTSITVLEEYITEKYELRRLAASLPGIAIKNSIPSFTVELPSLYRVDEPGVEVGFKVLKNISIALGLIEDSFEDIVEYPVIRELGYRREDVNTSKGGFIDYKVSLGDKLDKGKLIAYIRNVFGDIVEEVKMPKDGYIVSLDPDFRCWTGSTIALIAVKE